MLFLAFRFSQAHPSLSRLQVPLLGSTLQRRSYMAMNHRPEKQTSQVTYLSSIESQNPWMEAQPTFSRCCVPLVCSPYAHPYLGRCIHLPPEVSRSHPCAQLITSTTWSSAGPIVRAPVPLTTANPLFFSPPHPYQLVSKSGHFLTSALSEHAGKKKLRCRDRCIGIGLPW